MEEAVENGCGWELLLDCVHHCLLKVSDHHRRCKGKNTIFSSEVLQVLDETNVALFRLPCHQSVSQWENLLIVYKTNRCVDGIKLVEDSWDDSEGSITDPKVSICQALNISFGAEENSAMLQICTKLRILDQEVFTVHKKLVRRSDELIKGTRFLDGSFTSTNDNLPLSFLCGHVDECRWSHTILAVLQDDTWTRISGFGLLLDLMLLLDDFFPAGVSSAAIVWLLLCYQVIIIHHPCYNAPPAVQLLVLFAVPMVGADTSSGAVVMSILNVNMTSKSDFGITLL